MKKRLFDFSPAYAVITVSAYVLLTSLFGYVFLTGRKVFYAVLSVLFLVSFLFVFVYFVVLSVQLTDEGVRQGDKRIGKKDLSCHTEYDVRFRESVVILRDKRIDYRELSSAAKKKKTIRVQATKSNLKKLGDYLGVTLEKPTAPKRKNALPHPKS